MHENPASKKLQGAPMPDKYDPDGEAAKEAAEEALEKLGARPGGVPVPEAEGEDESSSGANKGGSNSKISDDDDKLDEINAKKIFEALKRKRMQEKANAKSDGDDADLAAAKLQKQFEEQEAKLVKPHDQPAKNSKPDRPKKSVGKQLLVDPTLLWNRICKPAHKDMVSGIDWYSSCCGNALSLIVSLAKSSKITTFQLSQLPTYKCKSADRTIQREISCAFVMDDYCDCVENASDEPTSSACDAGIFKCRSGVMKVENGKLVKVPTNSNVVVKSASDVKALSPLELASAGYIPSSKVGDGINDCQDGEDENGFQRQ
jgi:hypothetical protein